MASPSMPGPSPESFVDPIRHLLGQTVVVIDGVSDVGLAMTREAKAQGARLIITGRDPGRLDDVADEIGVDSTAAFNDQDIGLLEAFLVGLPTRIDHIALCMRAAKPVRLSEDDFAQVRQPLDSLVLPACVAWFAVREMTEGGSVVFVAGTSAHVPPIDLIPTVATAALSALVTGLAQLRAGVRTNLITASPTDRPDDVAALAVGLMTDAAADGINCSVT